MLTPRHIGMNCEHTQASKRAHGIYPINPILVDLLLHDTEISVFLVLSYLDAGANFAVRTNNHQAAVGILGAENHAL